MLCKLKSKIPTLQINYIFYSIPCNDCDSVYIGKTIRPWNISLKKYKKANKFEKLQSKYLWIAQYIPTTSQISKIFKYLILTEVVIRV